MGTTIQPRLCRPSFWFARASRGLRLGQKHNTTINTTLVSMLSIRMERRAAVLPVPLWASQITSLLGELSTEWQQPGQKISWPSVMARCTSQRGFVKDEQQFSASINEIEGRDSLKSIRYSRRRRFPPSPLSQSGGKTAKLIH
jgi:hypothetical protein